MRKFLKDNFKLVVFGLISLSVSAVAAYVPYPVSSNGTKEYTNRAYITNGSPGAGCTGTCVIQYQSGSWLTSVTRSGTGTYTVNFATAFSAVPQCFITQGSSAGLGLTKIASESTTTAAVQTFNGAGTALDMDFKIMCVGPR